MNKWNAVGFLTVNALLLAFFALSTGSVPMQVFAWVFCGLNTLTAINGALRS
jgi:hypothetical protein